MKKPLLTSMKVAGILGMLAIGNPARAEQPTIAAAPPANPPIGAIVAFAGPADAAFETRTGWMICDGRALDRTKQPALFAAIGSSWGGDGVNSFNVPDLRGMFLRGVDNRAGKDPDSAGRSESKPGGHRGDSVGSIQEDEVGHHAHSATSTSVSDPHHHQSRAPGPPSGSSGQAGHDVSLPSENTTDATVTVRTTTVVAEAGGKETRPKNAYVIWLIRFQ